jgi:ATP-dependent helicase/nuclease subunit A
MSDADLKVRRTALDPRRSFLVQAPAGSGKTELLIQRYLTLLAAVETPEQVVAITFTRKAAAEMRERILAALANAETIVPRDAGAETSALAASVIARDRKLDWRLLEQPHRLRIDTLDALNASLARQLPLLSGGVAGTAIVENATHHYREAAARTVQGLFDSGRDSEALTIVIRERANDLESLQGLLAQLLPRRDQWLRHLVGRGDDELRSHLEQALAQLVDDALEDLDGRLVGVERQLALELLAHAASHGSTDVQASLHDSIRETVMPPPTTRHLAWWKGLARLLLTDAGRWRRRVPTQFGLALEHPTQRTDWHALLDGLRDRDGLLEALLRVARLPPCRYDVSQWRVLAALRTVLVRLAAELRIVFAEQQVIDFVELALAAQQALGSSEAPSELLLALDRRIEHILVDEFQDTSHQQLRLLELLTSGWQRDDGRTLFLVGDPMQSIYRFRDADISLFLAVGSLGVGPVAVESLRLTQNFRSVPALVDWVNDTFAEVFPAADDLEAGAARFVPSRSTRPPAAGHGVRIHALRSEDVSAEIACVAEIVDEEMRRASRQSLGILVQSRSHLRGLRKLLAERGWPAHAVEIDAFETQQLGQDLIGLVRALSHFGDRIAWLGLLRAPWCGLTWADLEALCREAGERPVWELMHDRRRLGTLSPDGLTRLLTLRTVMTAALAARAATPFTRWVERTWEALGGVACLEAEEEVELARRFFVALNAVIRWQDLDDPAALEAALAEATVENEPAREAGIEIMTIHRAKGLEFDTVVLLGLSREPPLDVDRGLYWAERLTASGRKDLLMAPLVGQRGRSPDALTNYLKDMEQRRDLAERARLLYVAATRARERLHLVARLGPSVRHPPARSLLACLWSRLEPAFRPTDGAVAVGASTQGALRESFEPRLRRYRSGMGPLLRSTAVPTAVTGAETRERPPFEWAGHTAAAVGTLVHRELHGIIVAERASVSPREVIARSERYRRELALLGVEPAELGDASARVAAAVSKTLEDPRGQWILASHCEGRSELPLTVRAGASVQSVKLDRTFVEAGVRWIIDFKTSVHEGGALDRFIAAEVERYRAQLEQYGHAMARIDPRPLRLGLYFPLLGAFCSWSPGGEAVTDYRTN